jgi:hypothetical protein
LLLTKKTPAGQVVDFDRSSAFVMVDHQVAHVYAKSADEINTLGRILDLEGVEAVEHPAPAALRHRRSGDLVLRAEGNAWFDYRWWTEANDAPAFAKTVDIHQKPGYDPLELFWDRASNGVSQNSALIKGSHGIAADGEAVCVGPFEKVSGDGIAANQIALMIERVLEGGSQKKTAG